MIKLRYLTFSKFALNHLCMLLMVSFFISVRSNKKNLIHLEHPQMIYDKEFLRWPIIPYLVHILDLL